MCVYIFLVVLGLHCCTWAFSSCGEQGLLFLLVLRFLIMQLPCCGARALGMWALSAVALGLGSCGSLALEHKISSCGP